MKFAPEYFEGEVREGFYVQPMMKKIWAAQIEVLSEIDRLCERHDIRYVAAYGTLLGAVRHGGFIPWDDDLDIAMLREDYERFLSYARQELPKEWKTLNCDSEKFDHLLIRVFNSTEMRWDPEFLEEFHGCPFVVGVEIFPMDCIPDDDMQEKMLIYVRSMLDVTSEDWELYEAQPKLRETKLKELEELTGQCIDRTKPIKKQLLHLADRTAAMYWKEDTQNVAIMNDLGSQFQKRIPRSLFDRIIRVPFENITVPIVENYSLMLERYFGEDYMEPRIIYDTHEYPCFAKWTQELADNLGAKVEELPSCFDSIYRKNGVPLVSIIISCYNVEEEIDRCLSSLLCQTIVATNLEIICVDRASTDGTAARLKKWERKLCDMMMVVECDNAGTVGMARNIGLEYATGDYVAFVGAADWVEMDYLERLWRPTEQAELDVVSCACKEDSSDTLTYFADRGDREIKSFLIDTPEKRTGFMALSPMGSEIFGKMIKREFLVRNQIIFPEQDNVRDAYFSKLLHYHVSRFYLYEETLYHRYLKQ